MNILAQQLRRPKIKPKWHVPLGVMESVVAYNCRKHGFPIPVLAMPMWEGAGNKAYDLSGKMQAGSFVSTPDWVGECINFTRTSNEYINAGILNLPANLTIAVGMISHNLINTCGIVSDCTTGGNIDAYGLESGRTSNTTLSFLHNDNVIGYSNTNLSINKKYNIALTRSGSTGSWTINFFVDGKSDGNSTTAINPTSSLSICAIGNHGVYPSGLLAFDGYIFYTYMWDIALTASQIKFLNDNPYFMFEMPEELWGYAAAVGGFQAAWARNSNQLIYGVYQ